MPLLQPLLLPLVGFVRTPLLMHLLQPLLLPLVGFVRNPATDASATAFATVTSRVCEEPRY